MDEQQNSNATRHLQVIYTDIAQRVHAITAAHPIWPCHKGCDGVILGNQGAIERALHQQCGEVKPLVE